MNKKHIDVVEFRKALSQFATGVTVVTTLNMSGEPVGMTATSFNSVSLTPPVVLWSISKEASQYDVFCSAEHFAIHVLAAGQGALSAQFSRKSIDRFSSISYRTGLNAIPILPDYAACFQCSIAHRYDGGDHTILVGRVDEFERRNHAPLLFHGGGYAQIG